MRFPYRGAGIALIYSDSEDYILLGRRSDHPFHNRWSVPGGGFEKLKDNDTLSNAVRELHEETNIDFKSLQCNHITDMKLSFPFFNWTTFIFTTESKITEYYPNEFYELKWINIKDINQYKLRPFTRREIKTFYKARHLHRTFQGIPV